MSLLLLLLPSGSNSRYWVGGTGNWSDTAHWSYSSGGASGAPVPTSAEDVYFDANSFSAVSQTVTLTATSSCQNMNWTGALNNPTFNKVGFAIKIYGSLTFISAMTLSGTGAQQFFGSATNLTITTNGLAIGGLIQFRNSSGKWTLQDNLTTTGGNAGIAFTEGGTFDTNGKTITNTGAFIRSSDAGAAVLTLGASQITTTAWTIFAGDHFTLNAGTSQITITRSAQFFGANQIFYDVILQSTDTDINGTGTTILGSNTFRTLTLTAGKTYFFTNGTTQTLTNFVAVGTASSLITIRSDVSGLAATLFESLAIIDCDYLDLKDSTASGGAYFYAGSHSINNNNNFGWIFDDAPDPSLITYVETNITRVGAVGHGFVEGIYVVERGFVLATHSAPTISDNKYVVGGFIGSFDGLLSNLTPDTTYYYRAYVTTLLGVTTYGQQFSFSTLRSFYEKNYVYKSYSAGVLQGVWSEDVISEPRFPTVINGGPGELRVRLARGFENYGEGVDVNLNNRVDVYCFDGDQPSGLLIYRGFISTYTPYLDKGKEFIEIVILPYIEEASRYMLRETTGATTVPFLSKDPSDIFRGVLSRYQADGGTLGSSLTSIDNTGVSVSYTFNTNTVREGLDKCVELAPEDWYWRADPDGILYFKHKATTVTHDLSIGQHIVSVQSEKKTESIINRVYFIGGGSPPLFKIYQAAGSISAYGLHAVKIIDQRVTVEATAQSIANRLLNQFQEPEVRTKITIVDNNGVLSTQGYDIESIKVGDTIRIKNLNFGSQSESVWDVALWDVDVWDYTLSSVAGAPLTVVKVTYTPNMVEVETSSRFPVVTKRIEDINRSLESSITKDNPTSPT
jgi:hypothetical protein